MEISYPNSNRVGKFNITYKELISERGMCGSLFSLCTVLHVEDHESGRGKTYIAASELFQPLVEGEEIPEYRIEFAFGQPFENPESEARRVNCGLFGFCAHRQILVRVPPAQVGARPHRTTVH